jgi:hypothetical protein
MNKEKLTLEGKRGKKLNWVRGKDRIWGKRKWCEEDSL